MLFQQPRTRFFSSQLWQTSWRISIDTAWKSAFKMKNSPSFKGIHLSPNFTFVWFVWWHELVPLTCIQTSKTLSESSLVFQQITSKLDIFINCKASFCLIGVSQTLMKPWKGFKKKPIQFLLWLHSTFHVSAWIGSIAFGVNFLFGPVASSLCQRFSCRLVAAAGGLIAVLGFLMTSFANSVYVMYFTYSVVWGFGSSLSFAASTIVLGEFKIHLSCTYNFQYAKYKWYSSQSSHEICP